MVAAGGIDSIDMAAESDYVAHMVVVVLNEDNTGFDTDWVGTVG